VLDQAASSATNLGLSILAGRLLGPDGLGIVFVSFSAYLVALGLQRALFAEPLVITSAALGSDDQQGAIGSCIRASFVAGISAGVVVALTGWIVGGNLGRALALIAIWLPAALIQDLWRTLFFQQGDGRAAALNDTLWLVVMIMMVPFAVWQHTTGAVLAAWGTGALTSGIAGFRRLYVRPSGTIGWWTRRRARLAGWFAATHLVLIVGNQAAYIVLVALLSPADLGGLRAAFVLFAPMTLLWPALTLPGLPAVSRRLETSLAAARRGAVILSGLSLCLVAGYALIALLSARPLLGLVFGEDFGSYQGLALPIAAGQIIISFSVGFALLAKALERSPALLAARTMGSVTTFLLIFWLATEHGPTGAAWAMSIGAAANAVAVIAIGAAPQRAAVTVKR